MTKDGLTTILLIYPIRPGKGGTYQYRDGLRQPSGLAPQATGRSTLSMTAEEEEEAGDQKTRAE
jgi:hypothetical protein